MYNRTLMSNPSTAQLTNLIKCRTRDQHLQQWYENVQTSRKSLFYRIIKREFKFEPYLDLLTNRPRKLLTKFRTSNHKLPVETGRWNNTPFEDRTCPRCATNFIGDEYHYLFECPVLNTDRRKTIPTWTFKHPNTYKTHALFDTIDSNTLLKLTHFLTSLNALF